MRTLIFTRLFLWIGKDENVSAVVASGAVVPLLDTLELPDNKPVLEAIQERRKLIEAATRALKAIFASSKTVKYDTFTVSNQVQKLGGFLSNVFNLA